MYVRMCIFMYVCLCVCMYVCMIALLFIIKRAPSLGNDNYVTIYCYFFMGRRCRFRLCSRRRILHYFAMYNL